MEAIQKSVSGGLLRALSPARKLGLAVSRCWPWPVRVKLLNGRHMYVDIRSRVGRRLFVQGQFDPEVFTPIRGVLKTGGTFLDVGSNAGFYSMLALDLVGPTGSIHAFDVDPRPLRCLRKTIQTESISNLIVHAKAVSNKDGMGVLEMIGDCGWTHLQEGGTGPTIPTITLDTWRTQNSVYNIQAIKMDIEGGELAALQGAVKLLQEERPLLVCEMVDKHISRVGYKSTDIVHLLESIGYRTRWHEGVWFPGIIAEWAG
jgi:FkbM family methyltransferase